MIYDRDYPPRHRFQVERQARREADRQSRAHRRAQAEQAEMLHPLAHEFCRPGGECEYPEECPELGLPETHNYCRPGECEYGSEDCPRDGDSC